MTALTADRNTPRREGDEYVRPVLADEVIYQGALVALDANGYLVAGAVAATLTADGRAEQTVDATGAASGALTCKVRKGRFRWANAGDVDMTHVGASAYIVDDQTVSADDDTASRSAAGTIVDVDADGVWVRTE